MKKLITIFILSITLLLVACTPTAQSNARAYVTAFTQTTTDATFKVEVRDPDNELDSRVFTISVIGPDGFEKSVEETIEKTAIRTIRIDGLSRVTNYKVVVAGIKNGAPIELYSKVDAFKTVAQGDVKSDPLFVTSVADFKAMDAKKHYKLGNDIDFLNESVTPLFGSGSPFNGSFDGDSFTLKNINITAENDVYKSYLSLFGYASKSSIENVKLDNVHIDNNAKPYIGIHYVGLLVSKVSNNEFKLNNIEITNSSITIKHNLNQSTTNRNLYVGLLGGSLQGQVSNIVIKDSSLNVTQNAIHGTYSGTDAATAGSYIGGAVGLIEQDKGINISKIAVIDTDIDVVINQDKKSLGTGLIFVGGIFGAYRSDKNVTELVSNATISFNHTKHVDTEQDKIDTVYLGGLVGSMTKANASDLYYYGAIDFNASETLNRVYVGLAFAESAKSASRILANATLVLQTTTGTQATVISGIYNNEWANKLQQVKIMSNTAITIDGVAVDLSSYTEVLVVSDFITSEFINDLI